MLTAELRHMDGIKGNFSIVDERDYQATATVKEGDPPDESVLSMQGHLSNNNNTFLIRYGIKQYLLNRE